MTALEERVLTIARQARWRVLAHGLAWLLVFVVGAMLALGLADYLFRWRERGLRVMATLAVVGAGIFAYRRFLRPALGFHCGEIETARRIEHRFPHLRDQLSSALEFTRRATTDPLYGSAALRRSVVTAATASAADVDFHEALDPQLPRQTGWITAACVFFLAIPFALDASGAARAAARLMAPWLSLSWPRRTQLTVEAPDVVPVGTDFQVQVTTQGQPPSAPLMIHYRSQLDQERSYTMSLAGDAWVHQRNNVGQGFWFRVEGGDDDTMPWREVRVVEAPQWDRLALEVTPPTYSGWPVVEIAGHGEALAGSLVRPTGLCKTGLRRAVLWFEPAEMLEPPPPYNGDLLLNDKAARGLPLHIDQGGVMRSPDSLQQLVLRTSGRYWIEMEDQESGVAATTERWDLKARIDAPPTIAWELPQDGDEVSAVASAALAGIVKDDLALRRVTLEYTINADQQRFTLFEGPDQPAAPAENALGAGEQRRFQEMWDLQPLSLSPGDLFRFRIQAEDYAGQAQATPWRKLKLLSPDDLEDVFLRRNAAILARLEQALQTQRQAYAQANAVAEFLRETSQPLSKGDVDRLQGSEVNQRSVQALLDPPTGAVQMIDELLRDVENNRLPAEATQQRLQLWRKDLVAIGRGPLSQAERGLVQSLQWLRDSNQKQLQPLMDSLTTADSAQLEVIARLEALLRNAEQWDARRRSTRDLAKMLSDQQTLSERSEDLRLETLGRDPSQWSEEQRRRALELSNQQASLGASLRLQKQRIQEALAENPSGPKNAGADQPLADSLDALNRQAVDGRMREAARELRNKSLSQAQQSQRAIEDALRQALAPLIDQDTDNNAAEQADAATQARRAAEQLAQMLQEAADRQSRLRAETQQLESQSERDLQWRDQAADTASGQRSLSEALQHEQTRQSNPLWRMALDTIQQFSRSASQRLEQQQTDGATQQLQTQTLAGMQQLLDGLASPPPDPNPSSADATPPVSSSDGQTSSSGPTMADLKLLRYLQVELRRQTAEAASSPPGQEPSGLLLGVAQRQGALAELTRALLQPSRSDAPGAATQPAQPDGEPTDSDLENSLDDLFDIR